MKKVNKKILKYNVVLEEAKEGGYTVSVPALPGCFTEGDTFEESLIMAKDAIKAYLESMALDKEPVCELSSNQVFLGTVEVEQPKNLVFA